MMSAPIAFWISMDFSGVNKISLLSYGDRKRTPSFRQRKRENYISIYFSFFSRYVGNFNKKRLQHRSFPVKFAKFLIPILKNIWERLFFDTIELSEKCGRELKLNTEIDSYRDMQTSKNSFSIFSSKLLFGNKHLMLILHENKSHSK